MCPRSCDPFYIIGYYIKWVTTSWTHCKFEKPDSDLTLNIRNGSRPGYNLINRLISVNKDNYKKKFNGFRNFL